MVDMTVAHVTSLPDPRTTAHTKTTTTEARDAQTQRTRMADTVLEVVIGMDGAGTGMRAACTLTAWDEEVARAGGHSKVLSLPRPPRFSERKRRAVCVCV